MNLVSVVIPTRNRPDTVQRAIRSVIAQSYPKFEIVVVIDGPDPLTEAQCLEAMDPRVQVLSLPENVGLAEARNQGIGSSRGRWIALLDDDDEWLPEKLEKQVDRALQLGAELVFVPCQFFERTRSLERVMPLRLPNTPDRFSEYIYCEGGYLQPSMYFMSKALCVAVPFTKGLRHIEDSDWLLRMARHPGVQIAGITAPLSIYYNLKSGDRESETTPWKHPLEWAIANHHLFTRRAFPFFVGRLCLNARRAGEPITVLLHLLKVAGRYGSLSPRVFARFVAYWFLPDDKLRKWHKAVQEVIKSFRPVRQPTTRRQDV